MQALRPGKVLFLHPPLRNDLSSFIHFYAVGERRGLIPANLRKSYVGNFHDGCAAFLVKTRDGKSRKPQNFLYFRYSLGSVDVLIGKSIRIVAMLEGPEIGGAGRNGTARCHQVAEVEPHFVDAARRVNQSIPMPERRRKRKRAERFHLQL